MYYVYMLRCHDDSIYTGITKDISRRVNEHYYKTKEAAKYTRTRNIVSLECLWITKTRSQAAKLEYYIKHLSKSQKEKIILNPNNLDMKIYTYVPNITLESCLISR